MIIERGPGVLASLRDLPASVNRGAITNGLVSALFGMTGPLLLVLTAAQQENLDHALVSSGS